MKTKMRQTPLALSLLFAVPGLVTADKLEYEYAAQFNCGANAQNPARIQAGEYSSVVRARNASSHDARVVASFAVTFPAEGDNPGAIAPGKVIGPVELSLEPGKAVSVGCGNLEELANLDGKQQYFAGVLTLLSDRRHNVFATYTVMKDGQSTGISVDRIPNSGEGNQGRDF